MVGLENFAYGFRGKPMKRKSHNKHIVIFRLLGLVPLFLTAALNGQTVVLTPPSLIFAGVVVGTTSAPKNISLSNTGNATLLITSIIASASFAETNTCGGSVAAGKNCLISVTFSPTATGSVVGTVTITD